MKFKISLYILVQIVYIITSGQDKELLKQYVFKQFEVLPSMEISYGVGDFMLNPKPKSETDELSLKRVDELTDSFKIYNDISYLERIGNLYIRFNQMDTGRYYLREAAAKYQEKLIDNPDDTELLQNLCSIYMELGEPLPAIEFADRIIDINPSDSFAIFTNTSLHLSIGDLPGAKKYCEKAVEHFPENPNTYLLKTTILIFEEYSMLNPSKSFEGLKSDFSYLQTAADTYKNNPEMQLTTLSGKLFVLYQQIAMPYMGNPPKSLKNFKFKVTKSDSLELVKYKNQYLNMTEKQEYKNHYSLYYSLGIIYFLNGDYSEAISYFKKSIDLRRMAYPEDANVLGSYNNIMTCYLFMGDLLNAKKWTKMKIKDKVSYKDLSKNYAELARYYLIKGHLHKGEKLLNKAIEIDSATHEAYVELANIQMINNNLKQAESYLDKCFKINPDCEELHESFILLTLYQGDLNTAKFLVARFMANNPKSSFAQDIKKDFFD